jgi:hypothetical protein
MIIKFIDSPSSPPTTPSRLPRHHPRSPPFQACHHLNHFKSSSHVHITSNQGHKYTLWQGFLSITVHSNINDKSINSRGVRKRITPNQGCNRMLPHLCKRERKYINIMFGRGKKKRII